MSECQGVQNFRRFLRRQGFSAVAIIKVEDVDFRYCCSGYDHLNERYFCRCYTLEEMRMIIRTNEIFWRFLV